MSEVWKIKYNLSVKFLLTFATAYIIFMPWHKREVMILSPRTGRPPKGETSKSVSLQLRISPITANMLKECSDALGISRTEVIEKGIEKIHEEVAKKK